MRGFTVDEHDFKFVDSWVTDPKTQPIDGVVMLY
jgi:hypothetical protein